MRATTHWARALQGDEEEGGEEEAQAYDGQRSHQEAGVEAGGEGLEGAGGAAAAAAATS